MSLLLTQSVRCVGEVKRVQKSLQPKEGDIIRLLYTEVVNDIKVTKVQR